MFIQKAVKYAQGQIIKVEKINEDKTKLTLVCLSILGVSVFSSPACLCKHYNIILSGKIYNLVV